MNKGINVHRYTKYFLHISSELFVVGQRDIRACAAFRRMHTMCFAYCGLNFVQIIPNGEEQKKKKFCSKVFVQTEFIRN